MNPTVYLETTIIGYLAMQPSGVLRIAANQQTTHEWWTGHRHRFVVEWGLSPLSFAPLRNFWRSTMETDPVVAEVRAVREQLAARLGFRVHDIVKEAQRQDAAGDRKVVRLPPRRPIAAAVDSK